MISGNNGEYERSGGNSGEYERSGGTSEIDDLFWGPF